MDGRHLISIVTGTHQRLQYLKLLVASVRRQFPRGLSYEFVIVDGMSTDGTVEWCEQQPDVRLIRHNALLGAIKAFTDGGYAAQGEYVALLNDDVVVHPNSLLTAIQYLETHPSCGIVAMADNRTSIITGDGRQWRTEGIGVTLPDGSPSMLTYGQCCVVRKELGDQADWWHANDPIISQSRVYGGDCALSAWLWEHGWAVDPVDGCAVDDLIVRDGLRDHNGTTAGNDSGNYYKRYPTVYVSAERSTYPVPERLRILYLPIYELGHPQHENTEAWMLAALQDYGLALEVDYLNTDTDLPALVKAWQPDLILTQIQGIGEKLTPQILVDMRRACPTALVINWNGDAHMSGLVSEPMIDLLRHVDLQTTVNAAALLIYEQAGIPAAYWQIAYITPLEPLPDMPGYDVLAQMNWYDYRAALFDLLYSLPYNVGVYGNDRRARGNTHYDFAAQAALYANATITVGDTFPFQTKAFISNRVLQCLRAGGFLLLQHSEALETYTGLMAGVHYVEWTDLADLRQQIDYWLKDEQTEQRAAIARAGQRFVRENFSCAAQLHKLFTELLPQIRDRVSSATRDYEAVYHADGIPR